MSWQQEKERHIHEVLKLLYQHRMIKTFFRDNPQGWTLISGLYSPIYIQFRMLLSYPELFRTVCNAMVRLVREQAQGIDRLIGIAMAGVPLTAGISLAGSIPAGFTRKLEGIKSVEALRAAISAYGEHQMVEGEIRDGDNLALVDDLVTRFDSKLVALEQVKHELHRRSINNVTCKTVLVVLDREQGGMQAAEKSGLHLISLIPFKTVGLPMLKNLMHEEEWKIISEYLHNPEQFQDPQVQAELRKTAEVHW